MAGGHWQGLVSPECRSWWQHWGSALPVLTAPRSRDCLTNCKGGEAEKTERFICEKASINLHEPEQSDDKKVLQLIGKQGKYLLQGQGRG